MSDSEPVDEASADTPTAEQRLAGLRDDIADVDRSLLELLRRRMQLAEEVGRVKIAAGHPILVPEVHDRVLTRARQNAETCGVSEGVMSSIFDAVMRGSVERQHNLGVTLGAHGGRRMLIVGGAGSMGDWLQHFLRRQGHQVDAVDPAMRPLPAAPGRFADLDQIDDLDLYDEIVVSVPLDRTPGAIDALVARRPRGRVVEIASIKEHLVDSLTAADEAGVEVISLHPMFGPGKSAYETLTFVLACRRDSSEERSAVEEWLRHPYTHLVPVRFEHHDRLMGWLLGLAHLSGMLFGCALTRSGLGAEELAACASTTYDRQVSTATSVLSEDPDLYYDIQRLNPHRGEVYKAARTALDELIDAVQEDEREDFRSVLTQAHRFLDSRPTG